MKLFDSATRLHQLSVHPLTHVNTKCKLLVLICEYKQHPGCHRLDLCKCENALTCGCPDGGGDGGAHGGDAVIVLGVTGLDGSQVTVTAGSEAAGQVQSLHGLRFHLAEHRLAHRFKLAIHFRFTHL